MNIYLFSRNYLMLLTNQPHQECSSFNFLSILVEGAAWISKTNKIDKEFDQHYSWCGW